MTKQTEQQHFGHTAQLSGGPHGHSLSIDGIDISHRVLTTTLTLESGHCPTLTVQLCVPELAPSRTEHTDVLLPQETIDALIQLGWMPPGAAPPTEVSR